jgi:NodT family efflux transporter outer membrane factor (OMF) lipoprotein
MRHGHKKSSNDTNSYTSGNSLFPPCFSDRQEFSIFHAFIWILISISLTSCSHLAGPDYQRPKTASKTGWSEIRTNARETINLEWWRSFGDPYLNDLVEKAVTGNLSLRVAAARIEEATAVLGGVQAGRLPSISANSSIRYSFSKQDLPPSPLNRMLGIQDKSSDIDDQYSVGLNWELDIWGKIRKGIQAQEANYHATEADWRAVWLTTVSDVSVLYFSIHQFDEQIKQLQTAIKRNKQILKIYKAQAHEGLVPITEVMSQEAEINRLQQGVIELRRQQAVAQNGLSTLLGVPAGEFHVPVGMLRNTVKLPVVPMELPSDLLSRRPDIIAAEYRVLAAHELVGQARLARLPSISLTADGGVSNILSTAIKMWTFGVGPSINIPIFDPKLKAQVKINKARTHVAEEEYRQTVIRAFEEVENALVNLSSRKTQQVELKAQLKNLEVVAERRRELLKEGLITQLEMFESERRLLEVEQALSINYQQSLADTITLYSALGGGWPSVVVGHL